MIQLNRIHLTSQTPKHVEITKVLSTSQRESGIIDCSLGYALSVKNKTAGYKIRFSSPL